MRQTPTKHQHSELQQFRNIMLLSAVFGHDRAAAELLGHEVAQTG
jgi:hypothetical protein